MNYNKSLGGNRLNIEGLRNETLFEHRFWLQILGDHSRFILNALSSKEVAEIQRAEYFINIFDELLENARREKLSNFEIDDLTLKAYRHSQEIREFKLHLLKKHLTGEISIGLPPTFINHMLNELEEYLCILKFIMTKSIPRANPVHHHLLWLLDGAGHAAAINSSLDDIEKMFKEKSRSFTKGFEDLYQKSVEMAGYLRIRQNNFPALNRLNTEAEEKMISFVNFLEIIEELRLKKELLGTINPLIPDHMLREECYYLTKLSLVSEIARPDCDPTKPRIKA
jgi:hypothetical protein